MYDLSRTIDKDAPVRLVTTKDPEGLEIMRHTAAHVMAQAVMHLYPNAQTDHRGPVVEDGFYYDIDMETLSEEAFSRHRSGDEKHRQGQDSGRTSGGSQGGSSEFL